MFGPGNQCSKGNPTLKRMAQLREEVFRAETPARSIEVLNAMYAMAPTPLAPGPSPPEPRVPVVGDTILVDGGLVKGLRVRNPDRPDSALEVEVIEDVEYRHVHALPREKYWRSARKNWAFSVEGYPHSPFFARSEAPPAPAPAAPDASNFDRIQAERAAAEPAEALTLVCPPPAVGGTNQVVLFEHVTRQQAGAVPETRLEPVKAVVTRVYEPGSLTSDLDLTIRIPSGTRVVLPGEWSWPDA